VFLRDTDAGLTSYLRRARRLAHPDPARVTIVQGDVLDHAALAQAMGGQDVVYANLAGEWKRQAGAIVAAMEAMGVRRRLFISSMGIHGEVPGQPARSGVAARQPATPGWRRGTTLPTNDCRAILPSRTRNVSVASS